MIRRTEGGENSSFRSLAGVVSPRVLHPRMLGRLVRSRESSSETETALLVRAVRPFISLPVQVAGAFSNMVAFPVVTRSIGGA
jgi:hypothetical protein